MPKLYYFQSPNFSINPESETAPKLGSIFPNLDRLTDPLNQFEHVYIPENHRNQSSVEDFKESTGRNLAGAVGLSANVAQGLAGTAEVMYAFSSDKTHIHFCETLETDEFEANDAFVHDSVVASQRVQAYLDKALPGRKRVYMITGLKIATGFSTSTSKETQHGPTLKVAADATALGIPAEAGPEIELSTGRKRTVAQGKSKNKIVFAYRVIRIKRRRDGQAQFKYKSGGKYSIDDDSDEEEGSPFDIDVFDETDILRDFPEAVPITLETSGDDTEAV